MGPSSRVRQPLTALSSTGIQYKGAQFKWQILKFNHAQESCQICNIASSVFNITAESFVFVVIWLLLVKWS